VSSSNTKIKSERLDPDIRFLLANERTLLAWIRTAVAVIAGGVALTQFGNDSSAHIVIGIIAILLGGSMASFGYLRFKNADKAIRRGELPPSYDMMVLLNKLILGWRGIRQSDV
jgi:putative membrane protein